jgi:hypothetical protein
MKGNRLMSRLTLAVAILSTAVAAAPAQDDVPVTASRKVADVPFGPGEQMRYRLSARFGLVGGGGEGSLSVEDVDTLHGFPTYRLAMRMKGGVLVWKVNDVQRSWLDVRDLFARRFEQKLDQTGYDRDRTLDFFPDSMVFAGVSWRNIDGKRVSREERGALDSQEPLDDVSFIYFLRTMDLEVGKTYSVPRYFKADGNPVSVIVLRRETIRVPAGEYRTIVVRPIIRAKGLFSEGGEAEVWLSDDDRRMPVRIKAKVSVGSLNMELVSFTAGAPLAGPRVASHP